MKTKWILGCGALYGFLGVALGAFAAHGLRLDPALGHVFETAVRYQLYHALVILILPLLAQSYPHSKWHSAALNFVTGVFIFSGSLYLLALTGMRQWGAVTPLGGLLLLAGWFWMLWIAWTYREPANESAKI